jgi:tRNA-specific 2-thiouridylase
VRARVASLRRNGRIELELAEPAKAVTPGQSGVMYDGERLLGGGILVAAPSFPSNGS